LGNIRQFAELQAAERAQLYAFTAKHDPERFPDAGAMERAYSSAAFEHGQSQFSCWEDGTLCGTMGAVVREASLRGEVFLTAVAIEIGAEANFSKLLTSALSLAPTNPNLVIRMGISPRHPHIETLASKTGFATEYEGLIMAYHTAQFDLKPDADWRVETVDATNREAYRQVLDEAFRNSPNGATVDAEQITELMAEIQHPDLLGLAWLDGRPAAAYELDLQGETGWIEALAVSPELQGRGVGKRMLAAAIARLEAHNAKAIKLLVMSTNETAVGLYQRYGFLLESVTSRWWRLTSRG
jgi:ribosomal protein S18 acetylase RimI-like enzyme